MKHISTVLLLSILFLLTSCCSNPEKYKQLEDENHFLRHEYSKLYRKIFEATEYPKLTKFEKQGYDWAFSHLWESSGMITGEERKRIKGKYGEDALNQWDKGNKKGWEVFLIGSKITDSPQQD